jgi:hypothetical protein
MLSTTKYAARCVLGTEVFYILCLGYGLLLTGKARELHNALFELLPGFVWGSAASIVWGAVLLAIFAWIGGWYIAWMHNTSIVADKIETEEGNELGLVFRAGR